MKNKIEFIKWLFNGLDRSDWWCVLFLTQQLIGTVLMFTLEPPYDIYAVVYILTLLLVGALYFFIWSPLTYAYKKFLRSK